MEIGFKISSEGYDDQGNLVFQRVRFYEGDTTIENEALFDPNSEDGDAPVQPVNRYRRSLMTEEVEYNYE